MNTNLFWDLNLMYYFMNTSLFWDLNLMYYFMKTTCYGILIKCTIS